MNCFQSLDVCLWKGTLERKLGFVFGTGNDGYVPILNYAICDDICIVIIILVHILRFNLCNISYVICALSQENHINERFWGTCCFLNFLLFLMAYTGIPPEMTRNHCQVTKDVDNIFSDDPSDRHVPTCVRTFFWLDWSLRHNSMEQIDQVYDGLKTNLTQSVVSRKLHDWDIRCFACPVETKHVRKKRTRT